MSTPLVSEPIESTAFAEVALSKDQLETNFKQMQLSQPARYADWQRRNENLENLNRKYHLPRIREIYSQRALVTDVERQALHATRLVIESIVAKTFDGTQGEVAEWTSILAAGKIDPAVEINVPTTIRDASLKECLRMMREASYDISEGVRFVRTPLVLPRLEYKYYVLDLERF